MKLVYGTRKGTCSKCKKQYGPSKELLWFKRENNKVKLHFNCFNPRNELLTSEFFDNVSSLALHDQVRVFECFENLEDKIAEVQEQIDNAEAESKENKNKDEDYSADDEDKRVESEEEMDEEYEEEVVEIDDVEFVHVGKKRTVTQSQNGKTVTNFSNKQKRSKKTTSTLTSIKSNNKNNYISIKENNEYESMTIKELKDICRAKKMSTVGRKADLVKRCTERDLKKWWSNGCKIA